MQSFQEYWKNTCPKLIKARAKEMYRMYVRGEKEVMGQSLTMMDLAKAKQALCAANVLTPNISISAILNAPLADMSIWADTVCEQKQEGTTPMNTEREYLNRRVLEVFRTLDLTLEKQFHLGENTSPKSYKDLIDWIKNDKFEIDKKLAKQIDAVTEEGLTYYGPFYDGIIWTGAGFKQDREGYFAAREFLLKELETVKEIINTLDAPTGLKALREFKEWTYEAPKSKKH